MRGGQGWPNGKKQDSKKRKFYFQSKDSLQCQIFKMQGHREPPASGDGDAAHHGRATGPGQAGAEPRAAGHAAHAAHTAPDLTGRAHRPGHSCPRAGEEGTWPWGCRGRGVPRGPVGRAQGPPKCKGHASGPARRRRGFTVGLQAGAPCRASHTEATAGLACPPRARDPSGPGKSWCRVSREGAQSHEPHLSQVPRPPEPQFPPCKIGRLQARDREEARDKREKRVTHGGHREVHLKPKSPGSGCLELL